MSLSAVTCAGGCVLLGVVFVAEPGQVQDLTLTPGQVPYKGVTARWRCPALTDRNTRITGFAVVVVSEVCSQQRPYNAPLTTLALYDGAFQFKYFSIMITDLRSQS